MNRLISAFFLVIALSVISACATVDAPSYRADPLVSFEEIRDSPQVSLEAPARKALTVQAPSESYLAEPVFYTRDELTLARPQPLTFPDAVPDALIVDEPYVLSDENDGNDPALVSSDEETRPVFVEHAEESIVSRPRQPTPVGTPARAPGPSPDTGERVPEPTVAANDESPAESAPVVRAALPSQGVQSPGAAATRELAASGSTRTEPHARAPETGLSGAVIQSSGSEVEILLAGSGWIYVGSEYAAGSVELLSKSRRNGDDLFLFELSEPGAYGLWFQQQNTATGSFDNRRVAVLRTDQEPGVDRPNNEAPGDNPSTRALASGEGRAPASETMEGADYTVAVGLLRAGDLEQAFRSLLDESAAFDPQLSQIEPDLLGEFVDSAHQLPGPSERSFWARVARSQSPFSATARNQLLASSIASGTSGDIESATQALVSAGEADPQALLSAAGQVHNRGNDAAVSGLISHAVMLGLQPGYEQSLDDRSLFLLARQLELVGPQRNLREALRLYRLITERFPLSRFWEQSRQRGAYIERHYIDVR